MGRLMIKRLFLVLACAMAVVLPLPATALGAIGGEPGDAPSDLQAWEVWSDIVNLFWTDNCSWETGFKIERKTGDGDFEVVGTRTLSEGSGLTVPYADETVSAGTTYTYRIRAYDGEIETLPSNEVIVYTGYPGGPAGPSGLEAVSTAWNRAVLTWTDDSDGELVFNIERKIGESGAWVRVGRAARNTTTWTDIRCRPDVTYFYRVAAVFSSGPPVYSEEASVTTPPKPPRAPALKQPRPGARMYTLTPTLEWAAAPGATGYTIQVASDVRFTDILLEVNTADLSVDIGEGMLNWNSRYYWRVRAGNDGGDSPWRRWWFRTALGEPPAGLTATAVSATQVDLSWEDNLDNEISFRIERSSSVIGRWVTVKVVGADVTSWSDTRCVSGVTYTYRIRAFGRGTFTGYSDESSATPGPDA